MSVKEILIEGTVNGLRVDSRVLEEQVQQAVVDGYRRIVVNANGQHGIGGRLWKAGSEPVHVVINGTAGQRIGSHGFENTTIEVEGSISDDVGWLNAGATIIVHGDATNGACNGMAQGKVMVAGNIGARGMTMTKQNPKYSSPELWVLGGVGDSFAEFMAGGTVVICGLDERYDGNILGDRPCVGMVGGRIFFRGQHKGFSEADARQCEISDAEWAWLEAGLKDYLTAIRRPELIATLANRAEWQMLAARKPNEKAGKKKRTVSAFRKEVWDAELGKGGVVGDLTDLDRSQIEVIVTGEMRRNVPAWENEKYVPPCQYACPTGIPVQKRWELVRKGLGQEAIDLILNYTPLPSTVCGYLCPNLCMTNCTRKDQRLEAVDISVLGKASLTAQAPKPAPASGKRVAVIGGGPAGMSVAWQMWLMGHEPVVYAKGGLLGGKLAEVIPHSRFPQEAIEHELKQFRERIKDVDQELSASDFDRLTSDYDLVVIAAGAQTPRKLPVEGKEKALTALEFLRQAKKNGIKPGNRIVIIGAGNVGCDVATEAHRLGATDITLLDVQTPASFGHERDAAEACGAKFRFPVFTAAITDEGVVLKSGELVPADTVVFSIGDQPELSFLPESIKLERGYIVVDSKFETSQSNVFAVGDSVKPGLLTDAVGAGRKAAIVMDARLRGADETYDMLPEVPKQRVKLEYYDPRQRAAADVDSCAAECASCGKCRDCGMCEAICPQQAISRVDLGADAFEYVSDPDRCIGCGFCEGACPCGIWEMKANKPLD